MSQNPDEIANAAVGFLQQGRTQEGLKLLRDAVAQYPRHCVLRHNLAECYRTQGDLEKAATLFAEILLEFPQFIPAYQSSILLMKARLAVQTLSPDLRASLLQQLAAFLESKGNALLLAGQVVSARDAYIEALQYWPNYAGAYCNLSTALRQMGEITAAEAMARRALALNPQLAQAWSNLGSALAQQERVQEAAECFQKALTIDPGLANARYNAGSGALFSQLYRDDIPTIEIAQAHHAWGKAYPHTPTPYIPPSGNEKLRVGFISGDFCKHAMMQFVVPVLEGLDRTRFDIVCYANQTKEDEVTRAVQALPLTWHNVNALNDAELNTRIAADKLHLLIDLGGHTHSGRLPALARKPVPVMAHWLGYMFTTGLPAFDYRLTDPWTDPPDTSAALHTEKLMCLEHSQFVYRPKQVTPDVTPLPAAQNGYITFGSLNNARKFSRSTLDTWSKLLAAVPNSRLLLQAKLLADPGVADNIRGFFEAAGVSKERLLFRSYAADYLATYHAIDIALDPFPYNGGTTSCDALWMGVPVLTLAGDRSVGRMGVSILTALDMPEWIANSTAEYVAIGQRHAGAVDALAAVRANLRARFERSSLRDERAFARDMARCITAMIMQPR